MKESMLIQNPWWEREKISKEKAKPYRRKIYNEIRETFEKYRQIIMLTGLRRVGKTTLMYQLIEKLLSEGVVARKILYFSFDIPVNSLIDVLKEYRNITKIDWKKENVYLFLDEIHKLKGWSTELKVLYDNLPNIKIIISGSASINLEKDAVINLAGRYFRFEVKPLSLREFSELYYGRKMKNYDIESMNVKAVFDEYIRKPFPEIIHYDHERARDYIQSFVVEKVLFSDMVDVFDKTDPHLLKTLSRLFLKDIGMVLNISHLSEKLHVSKENMRYYIFLLEFSKLIKIIRNYRPSLLSESRKIPKVYPYHPSLSYAYYDDISEDAVIENIVMNELQVEHYFRERDKEVDFILLEHGKIIPVEVKNKKKIERRDIKSLLWFLKSYNLKDAWVIYPGDDHIEKMDDDLVFHYKSIHRLLYEKG